MPKTILLTGATDGIGLATAGRLIAQGHTLLVHGRSAAKLATTVQALKGISSSARVERHLADLSQRSQVEAMASAIVRTHRRLDVIINNAGVFKSSAPVTSDGLDLCFVVNTLAPYLLTRRLLPHLNAKSRVVNISSAAQSPVDLRALVGQIRLSDPFTAYAQSKLALTMWSRAMAESVGAAGPAIIALNPGSMLGTKMVRDGFGVAGSDVRIGAEIVASAAVSEAFAEASGKYFDNDTGRFAVPHPDALDRHKCALLIQAIEDALARWSSAIPDQDR